jgi:alkanesulfonate monooxygenase SsuD/methylene tetrahydromethanopterin reductase-like flavin-dependent oxidoreductase (luciferase family)
MRQSLCPLWKKPSRKRPHPGQESATPRLARWAAELAEGGQAASLPQTAAPGFLEAWNQVAPAIERSVALVTLVPLIVRAGTGWQRLVDPSRAVHRHAGERHV